MLKVATIIGFHAVSEALRARRKIDRVHLAKGAAGSRITQVLALCRDNKVMVRYEDKDLIDRLAGGGVHQGIVAVGSDKRYADLEDAAKDARLVVVLDGIEDPHNLGAIMRTAHAAGAGVIVIPERRAVGLTPTAMKSAAGASEYLSVVRTGNVNRALEALKDMGFWIYGLDERGEESYDTVVYTLPTALVIGAEGRGLHEQVKKHCDFLVRIPLAGNLASLNASVATGVALFEWKRRFGGAV
jgi:23S rRNA (guanosine2251-2'-O)-methyltransferase